MYNTDLPNRAELPSNKQLIRSTIIAFIIASFLLVTIVLPAEYGIDPTRIGRVFGLTQMGEIKHQRALEAQKVTTDAQSNLAQTKTAESNQPAANSSAAKTDEKTVTLKPGEGVEIKMDMVKGAKVKYEWKASGAVNHDTHADGANKAFISYKKGTGVEGDAGELIADFDGSHGWFWRNRTDAEVTITLKINGEYSVVKQMD